MVIIHIRWHSDSAASPFLQEWHCQLLWPNSQLHCLWWHSPWLRLDCRRLTLTTAPKCCVGWLSLCRGARGINRDSSAFFQLVDVRCKRCSSAEYALLQAEDGMAWRNMHEKRRALQECTYGTCCGSRCCTPQHMLAHSSHRLHVSVQPQACAYLLALYILHQCKQIGAAQSMQQPASSVSN